MCGRGRCTLRPDDFSRACYLNSRPVRRLDMDRFRPSYNVAPGFNVPVVRREDGGDGDGVVSQCMKWGLVPSFTKQTDKIDHFKMSVCERDSGLSWWDALWPWLITQCFDSFNARSESIREKASFRRLLPKNRCLVSFEGFYEWKKDGSKKQPYYVHFKDGRPLVFAALYDSWKSSEGEVLYTFTIITTSSSSALEWLHDRMPVILGSKESTDCWLNDTSNSTLDKILKPYEEADLAWYPVTTAVGKISFDGPECIKEVKIGETKTISQFFSKKKSCEPEESKLEKTPVKEEELQECTVPKSEKEEPESQSTLEDTARNDEAIEMNVMEEPKKDELVESVVQKSVKEEPDSQEESVADTDDSDTKNKEKCGYVELSSHAKPSFKESDRLHISPAKKQRKGTSKGANDKQPTLFSFFGKN